MTHSGPIGETRSGPIDRNFELRGVIRLIRDSARIQSDQSRGLKNPPTKERPEGHSTKEDPMPTIPAKKTVRKARQPSAALPAAPSSTDPIAKLKSVEERVNSEIIGRADLVRGIMLSLIAGQNVLALGVPGTAKTMLVQRIAESFASGTDVFDILLTKFTKASEVFGPTDIAALENGEYRINTSGYLASAKVGIIDECFKGSSAILNALLRIANERTFRNGAMVEASPVRMLCGMSNEFPEDPALLAAFFDRFPSKFMVGYLDSDQFGQMIASAWQSKTVAMPCKITDEDFAEIDRRCKAVNFPSDLAETIVMIRADLKSKGVEISDRRWVQAIKLMAASAVYAGRDTITRRDLPVLIPVCWNTEKDRAIVESVLPDYYNPFEAELRTITDQCYHARSAIIEAANYCGNDVNRPSPDIAKASTEAATAIHAIKGARVRLEVIADLADDDTDLELLADAERSVAAIHEATMLIVKGCGGFDQLASTERDDI